MFFLYIIFYILVKYDLSSVFVCIENQEEMNECVPVPGHWFRQRDVACLLLSNVRHDKLCRAGGRCRGSLWKVSELY